MLNLNDRNNQITATAEIVARVRLTELLVTCASTQLPFHTHLPRPHNNYTHRGRLRKHLPLICASQNDRVLVGRSSLTFNADGYQLHVNKSEMYRPEWCEKVSSGKTSTPL